MRSFAGVAAAVVFRKSGWKAVRWWLQRGIVVISPLTKGQGFVEYMKNASGRRSEAEGYAPRLKK